SPLCDSLGRQTGVYTFPLWLPAGNLRSQRTPSPSLTQSLAMAPRGVVLTVICAVSPTVHHVKVTSECRSFHPTAPTKTTPASQMHSAGWYVKNIMRLGIACPWSSLLASTQG